LKQWNHIEKHVDHMVDDHYDYLLYAFRRFTLQAFEELLEMMDDKLFQNRYVIQTAYNYLRLDHRLDKVRESERQQHAAALDLYKQSDAYADLQKEMAKLEDEEEYKMDTDPEGYFTYQSLIDGKLDMTSFVAKVLSKNANAPDLHGKSIKHFLRPHGGTTRAHGNSALFFSALRSAINLHEHF
jgi:hypothetical protein